jgi:DNA invertase Pin-like site-specific DNA recombinase
MRTPDRRAAAPAPTGPGADPLLGCSGRSKIQAHHRDRLAVVYVRQSTPRQVLENVESTALQYQLARRAADLGWRHDRVLVIDDDLGQSAQAAAHRPGFHRLLAEVGLNHVGLVLGIEMSRLARSCKDWYQLLELCAVFRCLLADQDGVYEPTDYNDRLLLGLKGTMSEAELHVLRARMDQGKRHKAERGELYTQVPVGYVFLDSGEVALDPDQQVQAVVRLVFEKFAELGTGRAVARYLLRHGIRLPVRPYNGPRRPPLQWREPTADALYNILSHPIYAGAYAYGRRRVDAQRKQSGASRRGQVMVPMEQWPVLLRDHLPAYISWEQYLANRERLRQNVSHWDTQGPPRQGAALLGGLVYCDRCGFRMQASYPEAHRGLYSCCRPDRSEEQGRCPSVSARVLDALVSGQVLLALEPAALELSLQAHADLEGDRQRLHRHWQQRLERARYQVDRTRRQYEAVEPENRLVARELEGQWEQALGQQRQLQEEYDRFERDLPAALSRAERAAILALAQDIPRLWDAATTTPADRQIVIRHLVDRVRVRVHGASEAADVTIHWKGGFESGHRLRRPVLRYRQLADFERLVQRVQQLREAGQRSSGIAAQLNAEGFRAPKGAPFTAEMVRTLLSRQGLSPSRRTSPYPAGPGRDEWWISDLARELNVSHNGVRRWIDLGWVHARQLRGGARCWIVWADGEEVERLRRLQSQRQCPFPPELTTPKARPEADARRSKKAHKKSKKL